MGAKDYDFADDLPEYRGSNRLSYQRNKDASADKTRKRRKTPKSRANVGGIHNRRNKHINW